MGTLLKSCSWLFWILWAVNVHANATFSIDASTPVQFSDKQVLVAQDLTGQATAPSMLQRLNEFAPAAAFPNFRLDVTYWVYQRLENKLSSDLTLRLDASGWKNLTAHVIREDGLIQALPATGFVPPHNPYLTKSLQNTQLSEFPSPFPIFTLKAHEKVALLTRVNVLSLFPPQILFIPNLGKHSRVGLQALRFVPGRFVAGQPVVAHRICLVQCISFQGQNRCFLRPVDWRCIHGCVCFGRD